MDITNLILKLESALTDNPLDYQMVSKAIQLLKLGAVEYVDTFAQLPNYTVSNGQLYYVNQDGLYWASQYGWLKFSIDNSVAYSWGINDFGRLGDGTIVNKSSPVFVTNGFTNWCQVSAGAYHILGVRTDGTAWGWGRNLYGSLGDGTTVNKSSPISVVGGFTDWCQVSAGRCHSLGLRTNGTAWAWGCNAGRLGDGTTVNRSSPVSVIGGFTDWCQVSAGRYHSIASNGAGTVWAWGNNTCGALGDGTTVNKSSPISVVGGFTDWCQVSAGAHNNLGVRIDGTAWSWGYNRDGALGDGTTVNKSSPVSVIGGFTDWCQVSVCTHSIGVRTNGTVWSWGNNTSGQLGDGTIINKCSPVSVVGGFTNWCQVSAGQENSVAIRTNGTVWSWGNNTSGQLGDGTTTNKSSPVSVIGGFTDWCQVSAGFRFTTAIRKILS